MKEIYISGSRDNLRKMLNEALDEIHRSEGEFNTNANFTVEYLGEEAMLHFSNEDMEPDSRRSRELLNRLLSQRLSNPLV